MKTLFMNPSGRISSKRGAAFKMPRKYRRKSRKNSTPRMSNPRKRRRRSRRRNAGIRPFVAQSNPLILQNPRRRRSRRRNPSLNFKGLLNKGLTYTGGAAVGAAANILVIRRIENDWLRNGLRVAGAVAAGALLKGEMGAAAAGATLYPMFAELAIMFNLTGAPTGDAPMLPTGVDLNELAADLESALNEVSDNQLFDP
jgi:hypothetical protein